MNFPNASQTNQVVETLRKEVEALGGTLECRGEGIVRSAIIIKDGVRHRIAIQDDGVQFHKTADYRRGGKSVTRNLSSENLQKHLKEVMAIAQRRHLRQLEQEQFEANMAERVQARVKARQQFKTELQALGITSSVDRQIQFDKEPAADPTIIDSTPPTRQTLVYTRQDFSSKFSVETADQAAKIIQGLDALLGQKDS